MSNTEANIGVGNLLSVPERSVTDQMLRAKFIPNAREGYDNSRTKYDLAMLAKYTPNKEGFSSSFPMLEDPSNPYSYYIRNA
jgi:hypothetical protein